VTTSATDLRRNPEVPLDTKMRFFAPVVASAVSSMPDTLADLVQQWGDSEQDSHQAMWPIAAIMPCMPDGSTIVELEDVASS
jgi:hypothetical protein